MQTVIYGREKKKKKKCEFLKTPSPFIHRYLLSLQISMETMFYIKKLYMENAREYQ